MPGIRAAAMTPFAATCAIDQVEVRSRSTDADGAAGTGMLFVRVCYDAPGSWDLRRKHRAERTVFLDSGRIKIVSAGPLCAGDDTDVYVGTFMLIEAESREDVVAYHEADPFTKAGIYERVFITRYIEKISGLTEK